MTAEEEQKIGGLVIEHRRLSTFQTGDDGEDMGAWNDRMFPEPKILAGHVEADPRQHVLPF